jgi:hypothetical protein
MKKSIEERLADIESDIARLTKMQGCVLKVLLILHKTSSSTKRSEGALTLSKVYIESAHRSVDYFLMFFFGTISATGFVTSMYSLYFATLDIVYRVFAIVFSVLTLVLIFFTFLRYRRTSSQLREAEKMMTQTVEVVDSVAEEMAAADDNLAQALAELEELNLAPDDLASESRNGTSGPKDSYDRS